VTDDATAAPRVPATRRITVLIGFDAGVRAALAFLVGIVVARYLGPASYGTLALAIAVVTVLLPLGGLGTDSVLIQRLAEYGPTSPRSQALLRAASSVRLAGAVITAVAALGFAAFRSPTEALAIVLVAPALLSGPFEAGWGWVLASGRVGVLVGVRFAITIVAASARLSVVLLDGGVPALAAVTGLEILSLAVAAAWVARMQGARFAPRSASRRAMLRESLPILASGIFFLLMLRVDLFLVDLLLGSEATGQYAAVIRFAEATYLVASVAVAAAAPRIIAAHAADSIGYRIAYRRLLRRLIAISSLAALVLTLIAQPLISVLLGDEYLPAAPVLAIYAWSAVPVYLGTARDRLAIDLAITRTSVVNTMAGAALNVALNLALLPHLGLIGAGIATLISYTAMITVFPALDRRQRSVNRVLASAVLPNGYDPTVAPARSD
jgi:polysaccharide transporter, PST family